MDRDSFHETEDVASATECTGLFPALPLNDPEADVDVARLYAVHAPKVRNGVRNEGRPDRKKTCEKEEQKRR